jgi:NADPH:quinone reductase-like Zn-dependent oxidoreductase
MKALVHHVFGFPEVPHVEEVPMLTIGDSDLLVKVHAAYANAGDSHVLRGTPLPFRPRGRFG